MLDEAVCSARVLRADMVPNGRSLRPTRSNHRRRGVQRKCCATHNASQDHSFWATLGTRAQKCSGCFTMQAVQQRSSAKKRPYKSIFGGSQVSESGDGLDALLPNIRPHMAILLGLTGTKARRCSGCFTTQAAQQSICAIPLQNMATSSRGLSLTLPMQK